jgi:hypothetical protein
MASGRPDSNTSVFIEALANMMQTSRGIVKHLHDQLLALDVSLANQMNTRVTQRIIDRQAEQYVMAWQAAITAETDRDPYDLLRVMKNSLLEPGQSPALLKACKEMAVLEEEGNRNLATIRILRACALDPELLELLKGLIAGQGDPLLAWLDLLVQGYDALVIQQRKEFSQALTTNPERALKIVETAFSLPGKRFIMRDAIRAMLADESHKKAEQLSRVLLDQPNLPGHLTQWREMADQDKPVDELLKLIYRATLQSAGQASRSYAKLLNMDGLVLLDLLERLCQDARYAAEACKAVQGLGGASRGEFLPSANKKRQFVTKLAEAVAQQYHDKGIDAAQEALKLCSDCIQTIPGFEEDFRSELTRVWKQTG